MVDYANVLLNDGTMVKRRVHPLPPVALGDWVIVHRTSARFYENDVLFTGAVVGFETVDTLPVVLIRSHGGSIWHAWASPLMKMEILETKAERAAALRQAYRELYRVARMELDPRTNSKAQQVLYIHHTNARLADLAWRSYQNRSK